jgi:TolB protein
VLLILTAGFSVDSWRPAAGSDLPAARRDAAVQLPVAIPGSLQNPAWSPDGSQLLLTAFENGYNVGPAGLHLFIVASGPATLLTAEPDSDSVNLPGTSWTPATDRITFSSDRMGPEDIWTISGTGGSATRVTAHTGAAYYLEPSFSPDGQWIIFEVQLDEPLDRGSLWKVRTNGNDLIRLTDGPAGGFDDRQPNWSPTSDRILFQRRIPPAGSWNLFSMAADGDDLAQVTDSEADDTDGSWSPDGRWVVYSSDEGWLELASIFVIPATGGTPLRVTNDSSRYDGAPSWSRDGDWIAFESCTGDPELSSGTTLWRIAAPDVLAIFVDGFESGETSAWSKQVP